MKGDPALSVRGLSVRDTQTGKTILDDVSFDLRQGELVCLVGPSGSGKSTTALATMGLVSRPLDIARGMGSLVDQEICFTEPQYLARLRGYRLSMIFQDPFSSLNPVLPCGQQAEEPLKIHTEARRLERRHKVLALFQEMGFEDPERIYRSRPADLSGGQLQRVMIAMAIVLNPSVLIADEPTTALDPVSQKGIIDLLLHLKETRGMAILLITHDRDLASMVSDHTLSMRDGRLVEDAYQKAGRIESSPGPVAASGAEVGAHGSDVLVSVRGLTKVFVRRNALTSRLARVSALEKVSLEIRRSEIVGVIGASGSGKTTLGRCIAGLTLADSGEIVLDGSRVLSQAGRGHGSAVQMVYQSPYASLNPTMRVGEAVEEGPRARGTPRPERKDLAVRLLGQVGLDESVYDRFPRELSGGERQRVAIARALAGNPKLLVADEPTASLDERTGAQVLDLLKGLARTLGLSVLLISHDRKVIARVCDRVIALCGGVVIEARPEPLS